jgi:predicted ATPase/DNA-binding SARP family transcriptional activator
MTVRLSLFGSPTIEYGGESGTLPFERRSQLAVFLALKRSWIGRAELAAMLWPDQAPKLAYTNLRKTLFRLQSWPWADQIDGRDGALRFEVDTDVAAFESALREHRLADALSLRRGEFLAGFDDDDNEAWTSWIGFERERLRSAWRGAALERLAQDIDANEGIELSTRLLEADPLDEAALKAHMAWLSRDGRSAQARQAYRAFKERLAADLGLAPGSELKALHDSLGTAAGASLPSVSAPRTASDDGFVGRVVELRRIADLLAKDDCRLLSLVGPGGVGKTRLAQRVGQDLAVRFPDGVTFVPLEDVASGNEIGVRLARELGVRLGRGAEPLDQIVDFLRSQQALLVLDNFEHLAADAAMLERLLNGCPRLSILVTSRVRLSVAMERPLPLDGLPCPEAEDRDRVESFDAVRLFVQAAQRVGSVVEPRTDSAAIVDICRQVEGLPLALELAGAWTRVLSCEAIAAELRSGTELLNAVDTARPARHASMEVVFEHSWRLLGASERDALAKLSLFRGGFSSEAARAVAGASLPILGALADKSLIRKDGARLSMHPLVQQLAVTRLEGEARAAAERTHALYFHRLLAQLKRPVEAGDRDALRLMDTESENCRAALRWSAAHGAIDAVSKSAATLLHFCDHRGGFEETLSLLRATLASPAANADRKILAVLSAAEAHLLYRLDRYADAEATATRALAGTDDHDPRLQALKVLGGCNLRLGRYPEAKHFFEQALKVAPAGIDPNNAAAMLDNLALVEKFSGNWQEALRLSLESLAEHRRLRDVAGEALCLNNLGALYLEMEDFDAAGAQLREGLGLCERHGLATSRGLILANLTDVALNAGDYDGAERYAQSALEVAEAAGNRAVVSWIKLHFVRFALHHADLDAARAALSDSLAIAIALGRPTLTLAGVSSFADLLAAQGESEGARMVLAFAAGHPLMHPGDRKRLAEKLAAERAKRGQEPPWPGIELEELAHRIVVESHTAHRALIAGLRGALVH